MRVRENLLGTETKENLFENSAVFPSDTEQPVSAKAGHDSDVRAGRAVAKEQGVDFIDFSQVELSPHVARLLPQWLVVRYNVIAVKLEEDTLYIATTDPLNLPALDEINLVTGFSVKPVVSTERDISRAIRNHYGAAKMSKQDMVDARFGRQEDEQIAEKIEDLVVSDEAGQIVQLISSIMKEAMDSGASDIHFEPFGDEMNIRFRTDGILRDVMTIPTEMKKEVTSRVKILAKLNITEKRKAQDGHISLNYKGVDYDLRVSIIPTIDGEKTVIRILDKNRVSIDLASLGFDDAEKTLV